MSHEGSERPDVDPLHPPEFCPLCARSGVQSRIVELNGAKVGPDLSIWCENGKVWRFSTFQLKLFLLVFSVLGPSNHH